MSDWAHGYNISQGYTFGVYREIAPDWIDAATLLAGYAVPADLGQRRLRYLELGCGQGVGLALLAAAYPDMDFVGVDFGPEHIAHAQGLARAAGLDNVRFLEGDFLDLARAWPADFGQFDYVTLHGIYSWVPPEIRAAIITCLRHGVAPGGAAYVSYNAMPGWATTQPFQHVLQRLQTATAKPGPQVISEGVALFERLKGANIALFDALPRLKDRLENVKDKNPAYLVQEYLHRNWHPQWFSQVSDACLGAKLDHVGSATLAENLLPQMLAEPVRNIIAEHEEPGLRQDLIDCAINQSFRRDLFVRGRRKRLPAAPGGAGDLRVHGLMRFGEQDVAIKTSFGEFTLKSSVCAPISDAIADSPKSIGALSTLPAFKGQPSGNLLQAVLLLAHGGQVALARPETRDPLNAQRFNLASARLAAAGAPYTYLAAPAIGSALAVRDVDMMILDSLANGGTPDAPALRQGLLASLAKLGRKLAREGRSLDGAEADAMADEIVTDVIASKLPLWRSMGAVA